MNAVRIGWLIILILNFITIFGFIICVDMLPSTAGIIHCVIYVIFYALLIVSYIKTAFSNPGYIPKNWKPSQQLSLTTTLRHCGPCKCTKVPRAHHCSRCNRCIMRMDHHCPWVGNCIGARNHKSFFLTLVYAPLIGAYSFFLGIYWFVIYFVMADITELSAGVLVFLFIRMMFVIFLWIYSSVAFVMAIIVLPSQFEVLATNITTVESRNLPLYEKKDPLNQGKHVHMYDEGSTFRNLKSFLGKNILLWPIPFFESQKIHPEDWIDDSFKLDEESLKQSFDHSSEDVSETKEMVENHSTVRAKGLKKKKKERPPTQEEMQKMLAEAVFEEECLSDGEEEERIKREKYQKEMGISFGEEEIVD